MESGGGEKRGGFCHPRVYRETDVGVRVVSLPHRQRPPPLLHAVQVPHRRAVAPPFFCFFCLTAPKRFGTRSNYDPAYLRVRCIALTQYFQAVLRCERVRHTKDFYALFLPSEGVEARPAGIEEEEEEEEVLTTGRAGCVV